MDFFRNRHPRKHKMTIGILSVEQGCGATHLGISLAGYLAGVERACITVAELNRSGAFEKLEQVYDGTESEPMKEKVNTGFSMLGIDYQKQMQVCDIPQLLDESKGHLILDFGNEYREGFGEWKRCDISVVTTSFREWKLPSFHMFMREHSEEVKRLSFPVLVFDALPEDVRELGRYYGVRIRNIPREPDPFHIRRENFKFYQTLLERG